MNLADCKGHWALITGASSGIGREFAMQLAAAGLNLVLVARRKELLDALASDLARQHGIRAVSAAADLADRGTARALKSRLEADQIRVRLLCNNAAFGRWGRFEDTPAEVYEIMLQVNASALVALCHEFMAHLVSFPTSAIINVSSPASFQPVPYMAVYAASKAFVHHFSQALYAEWKERGVLVQTLVPGPTATEFDTIAGAYKSSLKTRGSARQVVSESLAHLSKRAVVASTAKGTYKQRLFAALFPPRVVVTAVARMFKPPGGRT